MCYESWTAARSWTVVEGGHIRDRQDKGIGAASRFHGNQMQPDTNPHYVRALMIADASPPRFAPLTIRDANEHGFRLFFLLKNYFNDQDEANKNMPYLFSIYYTQLQAWSFTGYHLQIITQHIKILDKKYLDILILTLKNYIIYNKFNFTPLYRV